MPFVPFVASVAHKLRTSDVSLYLAFASDLEQGAPVLCSTTGAWLESSADLVADIIV